MPWITEKGTTYWMPEVLPEPTEEYQQEQSQKLYLTYEGKEKTHPGWTYAENIAYVDDEYLFQNEKWKVIVDKLPTINENDLKHKKRNLPEYWEEIDERKIKVTYEIIDFTEDEVNEYIEKKWKILRHRRDLLLQKTDWIVVRANEENLIVSAEIKFYRQQLRDFPETIGNILEFNIENNSLWPIGPEIYFEI